MKDKDLLQKDQAQENNQKKVQITEKLEKICILKKPKKIRTSCLITSQISFLLEWGTL